MPPHDQQTLRPPVPGAGAPPRGLLGRDLLQAFEAYFAAEEANLEALARWADDPEFGPFYREVLPEQRRSLALLSFQVASMLPDHPAPVRVVPPAITSILTQNRARRARDLAASIGTRRRTGGLALAGAAAAAVIASVVLANPDPVIIATIAPRVADAAPIVASTPVPAPTPQRGVLEHSSIVAIYGHPYVPSMGLLGELSPSEAALRAKQLAAQWQNTDGRPTIGALHVVMHVAQASQTPDGTHLGRADLGGIHPWVEAAQTHGVLLIVDTQIGWSDPLTESKALEPLLKLPFVHLALDPEFALSHNRVTPGDAIGTVDARSINEVQTWLGDLVRREGLPRKMLMVHQFLGSMIRDAERINRDPDIEMVIDMDGVGAPGDKLAGYDHFALGPYSERPGFKLFTKNDTPLMTPAEITALPRPPDVVIYQ